MDRLLNLKKVQCQNSKPYPKDPDLPKQKDPDPPQKSPDPKHMITSHLFAQFVKEQIPLVFMTSLHMSFQTALNLPEFPRDLWCESLVYIKRDMYCHKLHRCNEAPDPASQMNSL